MILCDQIVFKLSNITDLAIIITVIGYVVVFVSLLALVFVIARITTLQNMYIRIKLRQKKKSENVAAIEPKTSLSADENAAICTALYLFFTELHDEEKYVMTVKKVSRTYSPWSSKIYGIMNLPRRG